MYSPLFYVPATARITYVDGSVDKIQGELMVRPINQLVNRTSPINKPTGPSKPLVPPKPEGSSLGIGGIIGIIRIIAAIAAALGIGDWVVSQLNQFR